MFYRNKCNNFSWSKYDWSASGKKSFMLNKMNYLRFCYLQSCLSKFYSKNFIENAMIADIGCGGGLLTEFLAKKSKFVYGIDVNPMCINIAKDRAKEKCLDINYMITEIADFAYDKSGLFDVVTVMETIEHVEDQIFFIKNCISLLKKNGIIFFSTINRNLKSILLAIIFAEYVVGMAPVGTHAWNLFLKPQELCIMLDEFDVDIVDSIGMKFNILNYQWYFSNKMDLNYILVAIKR